MKGVVDFKDYLKQRLKNKEFRKAYEEEGIYSSIAIQIAMLRQKKGLSQKALAKKLKTSQQTIARLENRGNSSYSIKTLSKIARALHKKLQINFV